MFTLVKIQKYLDRGLVLQSGTNGSSGYIVKFVEPDGAVVASGKGASFNAALIALLKDAKGN